MLKTFNQLSRNNISRINKFARKINGENTPSAVQEKKSKFGFLKSGLIIMGGFYGYKYFTGELEDINLYHVTLTNSFLLILIFNPCFNHFLVYQHRLQNRRCNCAHASTRISETDVVRLVCLQLWGQHSRNDQPDLILPSFHRFFHKEDPSQNYRGG